MTTLTNPQLVEKIAEITRTMDVPEFRQTSIHWLQKNAGKRNSDHARYLELRILLSAASERGIQ